MKKLISALIGLWVLAGHDPVEAQKVYRIGSLVATCLQWIQEKDGRAGLCRGEKYHIRVS